MSELFHRLAPAAAKGAGFALVVAILLALAAQSQNQPQPQAARPAGVTTAANAPRPVIAPPSPPGARPAPASFADLTEQLSRTVVNISTTQVLRRNNNRPQQPAPNLPEGSPFEDFFNDFLDQGGRGPRRVSSLGSGFIVDPAGYIVTNYHVIEDADEISVIMNDGITTLEATLVGRDPKTDLALLKVTPKTPLPAARFGDSDGARVGDWVIAIGNPFGQMGTVTAGIVSARNRGIGGDYDDFIQTDAAINRGNSGGPLFNMNGEVIGVNSAIYSPTGGSVGIGFAIPSNDVRLIIAQLRNTGTVVRGMIGINFQRITEEIASSMNLNSLAGALVSRVTAGGPAARAGLQNGDVILTYDGRTVDDRTLPRLVANTAVGKVVPVEFVRRGQKRNVNITVARLPEDNDRPDDRAPPPPPRETTALGVSLEALTEGHRNRYRIAGDVNGVVVTAVDPLGPAGDKLQRGDVIVEAGQERVTTPAQVEAKVTAELRAGKRAILLLVNRDGQQNFVGISIARAGTTPAAPAPAR
jgi:serine protease Do